MIYLKEFDINLDKLRFIRDILDEIDTIEEVVEIVYSQFIEQDIKIEREDLETILCGFLNSYQDFVSLKGIYEFLLKYNEDFRFKLSKHYSNKYTTLNDININEEKKMSLLRKMEEDLKNLNQNILMY